MLLGRGFYRFLGIVAGIVTLVQATIWIILSLCGIICYYAECGTAQTSTDFGKVFNLVYLNNADTKTPCMDPVFFHIIMWLYLWISIIWALCSVYLIYCKCKNSKKHKKSGPIWIGCTIFVCLFDFVMFVIFAVDFHRSLNTNFNSTDQHLPITRRFNFDRSHRRMFDFDNPNGEYTPEERELIKLSIKNEKANLYSKMYELEQISKTLNEFFTANKRNPYVLPPNFTSPDPKRRFAVNSEDNLPNFYQIIISKGLHMADPAAVMMTLALKGYIVWVLNVSLAVFVWHLHVSKERDTFLKRFSI